VHVSLLESDGGVYGVGMPIIAWFDQAPTDASAFDAATTVTVNGAPVTGAWYWEKSGHAGSAVEAHYRLNAYWPAHAKILLSLPVKGLSAGAGLAYDDSLTLSISTGAAHISTVDNTTHQMTVTSDGVVVRTVPVSLGAADHPTYAGTKVVMELNKVQEMKSTPGEPFYDLQVPWSVRLTNSGEFVHDASWNRQIGDVNTSHGCTNLNPTDAQWFFGFSQIGDVVTYPNAIGPTMPVWDGYGDWNLAWSTWQAGGQLG
jgi:lipoprotein-anchoring transpeptidase ErfK/SrfK